MEVLLVVYMKFVVCPIFSRAPSLCCLALSNDFLLYEISYNPDLSLWVGVLGLKRVI